MYFVYPGRMENDTPPETLDACLATTRAVWLKYPRHDFGGVLDAFYGIMGIQPGVDDVEALTHMISFASDSLE